MTNEIVDATDPVAVEDTDPRAAAAVVAVEDRGNQIFFLNNDF